MRKYLIIGPPKHGKSTLGLFLAERLQSTYGNTSDTIYEALAEAEGVDIRILRTRDKESLRAALIATGDALCEGKPAFLALTQLEKHQVVCGIRKPDELFLVKAKYPDSVVIWIERAGVATPADNTLLTREHADYVVSNNGDLGRLQQEVGRILSLSGMGLQDPGSHIWGILHGLTFTRPLNEHERRNLFNAIGTLMLISFGETCPCIADFEKIKQTVPPPETREDLFTWTLVVHDWVNHRRGLKPKYDWTHHNPTFQRLREAFTDDQLFSRAIDAPLVPCKKC